MAGVTLRPFVEGDYPALAVLQKAVHADYATPEDELRYDDSQRGAEIRFLRLVATDASGNVIGSGEYDQQVGRFHPRKFIVSVDVLPKQSGQGVGGALYDAIVANLARFDPLQFSTYIREGNDPGLRFAGKRGFVESRRIFPSDMDVTGYDPTAAELIEARLRQEGIRIQTIEELADDPERDQKLHRLGEEIRQDFPTDEPATPNSFEDWRKMFLDNPRMLLSAFHVAVTQEGDYIGYNNLASDAEVPALLWTKQTGVIRAHRRRGIATVLKARGAVWARANGYTTIRTTNDSTNAGMLAVNTQMGFVRQPAWISLKKLLKEEHDV